MDVNNITYSPLANARFCREGSQHTETYFHFTTPLMGNYEEVYTSIYQRDHVLVIPLYTSIYLISVAFPRNEKQCIKVFQGGIYPESK